MSHEEQKQPITGVPVANLAVHDAMAAAAEEKAMGFKAVMRIHWRAAMWSCIFSLALVMEGYDLGIVSVIWTELIRSTPFGDKPRSWNALVVLTPMVNAISPPTGRQPSTMPPVSVKSLV